jgi:naphthalene 1,2-dioxygenase system ferredoxin subunit
MSPVRWIATDLTPAAVAADGVAKAVAAGHAIAVYCVNGELFATSDSCTHGQASLSEGYLEGAVIECPLHQGQFDVRTGAPLRAPCTVAIRCFSVRTVEGIVHVGVPDEGGR